VGKYLTKASNGWHHSYAFTTGDFHEPIRITEHNREITEKACRKCHEDIVRMIDTHHASEDSRLDCIRCHSDVGHRTH
jgi:cytochrome c nitrite reductase small subunit